MTRDDVGKEDFASFRDSEKRFADDVECLVVRVGAGVACHGESGFVEEVGKECAKSLGSQDYLLGAGCGR